MKLEITKEKVLEAARACPAADATLRTLFPEAFKTNIVPLEYRGLDQIQDASAHRWVIGSVYSSGLFLSPHYNFEIVTDEDGRKFLQATYKNINQ
jgi:hypothetical protein